MAVGDDFIVQIVGGPNARTDFHVDPYEEWFYQLEGNMHVDLVLDGNPQTVHIDEGDTWLLPGNVPHSPQRPEAGSIGLVIERVRAEGTLEKFQWYCQNCSALVHEVSCRCATSWPTCRRCSPRSTPTRPPAPAGLRQRAPGQGMTSG